jgi:hypothetical protein
VKRRAAAVLCGALAASAAAASVAPAPGHPKLLFRVKLDAGTLAALQNPVFPGSIAGGTTLDVGSLFSSLDHSPLDPPDVFWAASDRGPNGEHVVDGQTRRVLHAPGFDPAIFRVRVDTARGLVAIESATFLRTTAGEAISGSPNRPGVDEAPYDTTGRTPLAFNANGIDGEALVRAGDGSFWLAEEYGPSLLHVAADGRVLMRYTPVGSGIVPPGYPVSETLPKALARRRANRGFESLALSADGRRLFAILQSPLANPDRATADTSRIVRILVVDAASGEPAAEHVLVTDKAEAFRDAPQSEVQIGDAACVNATSLLVVEHTDPVTHLVLADLEGASDILDTAWDDPATSPSLESLAPEELAARGIVPVRRTPVADLNAVVPDLPEKIESVALLDPSTVVFGNDNEYAARGKDVASQLIAVRLPRPLPVAPDTHTLANLEAVRPTHLSLELNLDFEAHRIRGVNTLTLAYTEAARADHLDLDTERLTIESVTDPATGKALAWSLEPTRPFLGERLRIALGETRPAKVRVAYWTSPGASALQWLEPRQTTSGKLPFLLTQSQATHARSWAPCADSPSARITYDATVRAPVGMSVVMSAERVASDPAKGVFRFRMPESIPPYLLALAAGEIAFQKLGPRTGVYAEPAVLARAASEFRDMQKMLRVGERLFGKYRWGRWDAIVMPPSFPFGGMENPRLTFATPTIIAGDRSLVDVMAHELAHSWSGNLVTSASWQDFWLNEGFTTYLENRIVEEIYGKDVADMQVLLANRKLAEDVANLEKERPGDTQLVQDITGRDADDAGAVAYEKGAGFLRVLEKQLGRARLDPFLRSYFDAHAFQGMTTPTLVPLLKRDLFKEDIAAWQAVGVEEWLYGRGIPKGLVAPASGRFDKARAAAAAFAKDGSLDGVRKDWVTAEWLEFLSSLPKPMTASQLDALDVACGFSARGNSEVLFGWLRHVVAASYEPAYPALERFLTAQGRRKFLKPLYEDMQANETTRALARTIYARARPGYHPISVGTVDVILKWVDPGL